MYNYTYTETESEHCEREGVDEISEERTWCQECAGYLRTGQDCGHDPIFRMLAEQIPLICSCGHSTCPLIVRFGLIEPIFYEYIEPIPSQIIRDSKALEMRAAQEAN